MKPVGSLIGSAYDYLAGKSRDAKKDPDVIRGEMANAAAEIEDVAEAKADAVGDLAAARAELMTLRGQEEKVFAAAKKNILDARKRKVEPDPSDVQLGSSARTAIKEYTDEIDRLSAVIAEREAEARNIDREADKIRVRGSVLGADAENAVADKALVESETSADGARARANRTAGRVAGMEAEAESLARATGFDRLQHAEKLDQTAAAKDFLAELDAEIAAEAAPAAPAAAPTTGNGPSGDGQEFIIR